MYLVAKDALEILAGEAGRVPLALMPGDEGPHDAVGYDGAKQQRVRHHIRDDHSWRPAGCQSVILPDSAWNVLSSPAFV